MKVRATRKFILRGADIEWGVVVEVDEKMGNYLLGLDKPPVERVAEDTQMGDYSRTRARSVGSVSVVIGDESAEVDDMGAIKGPDEVEGDDADS